MLAKLTESIETAMFLTNEIERTDYSPVLIASPLHKNNRKKKTESNHAADVFVERADYPSDNIYSPARNNHQIILPLDAPLALDARIGARQFDWNVGKDESAIVPAGFAVRWQNQKQIAVGETLQIYLAPDFLRKTAEACEVKAVELKPEVGIRDENFNQIGTLIWNAQIHRTSASNRLLIDLLSLSFAVCLFRHYQRATNSRRAGIIPQQPFFAIDNPNANRLPRRRLQRVSEYVDENISRSISLQELAETVEMSPFHFARLFKFSTGQTPHQYVLKKKVEAAKILLSGGKFTILETGLEVGFENQSHFGKVFRRLTGVSPKKFRDG